MDNEHSDEDSEVYNMYQVNSGSEYTTATVSVKVNRVNMDTELDTRVSITLISEEKLRKLQKSTTLTVNQVT